LTAFLLDCLLLSLLSSLLLWLVKLPPADPVRELELSMQLLQSYSQGRLPSARLQGELAELQRPRQLAGWLNIALCAAYFILFQGLTGTTAGKAVRGLRVWRRNGQTLGLARAALRYGVYLLEAKLLYGVFTMPFDPQRRALHDLVCSTNVFREVRWR
jgi:uncharacterized RDD family membrane protein YckC